MAGHARRTNADGTTLVAVITGTPAVGKSTVCRRLAQRLPIAARIEADRLQRFIVVGGQWPSAATAAAIEQPFSAPATPRRPPETSAAAGIPTFIDDVLCTGEQMAVLAEQVPHARLVVLAARTDVVLQRDAMRHKHTAANYKDVAEEIANVVGANATWVDTNGLTPRANDQRRVERRLRKNLAEGRVGVVKPMRVACSRSLDEKVDPVPGLTSLRSLPNPSWAREGRPAPRRT